MITYNQHVKWRGECGRRFGTIRDLPIVQPIKIARDIIAKQYEAVLDFGCGVQKVGKSHYDILDKYYFSLDIDPEILKEDKEMIEDMVLAAVNQGLQNAGKVAEEKMNSITGGMMGKMKIPGI